MQRITMSPSGRIQSGTVMVDSGGTIHNFVKSVAIYISCRQTMIALSGVFAVTGVLAVEHPTLD